MSIKNLLNNQLPVAANNLVGDIKTKAGEVGSRVRSLFSGAGSFKRLAAEANPFEKAAADLAIARAEIDAEDPTQRVMDAIDEDIRAMTPDPFFATDVDRAVADLMAEEAQQLDSVSAGSINATKQQTEIDTSHIVKLTELGKRGSQVIFRVMPEVVESRTVEYEAIAPPQFPSAFQKYKGTSSTQWSVNATFVCRTTDEATENLRFLNTLRGWTVPFFGTKTLDQFPDKLGAPPPVLIFSGWRSQMVGPVPVVITSLNWNFPQDVDYIPAKEFAPVDGVPNNYRDTGRLVPFPTVIKVAIQLVESFSTEQMNGFSIGDFRSGRFDRAFIPMPRSNKSTQLPQKTEAQTPPAGAFRGLRSDLDPARRVYAGLGPSVGGGRGVINPPVVVPDNIISEAREVAPQVIRHPLSDRFESGGGGDFGGAGAGDSWDSSPNASQPTGDW